MLERQTPRRIEGYAVANNHIQNNLPIYLTHLPYMKLLRRGDVMSHLESVIDGISTNTDRLADSNEWHAHTQSVVIAETEYTILSHQWLNKGELSFQDLGKLRGVTAEGFEEACRQRRGTFDLAAILNLAKDLSTGSTASPSNNSATLLAALENFCVGLSDDEKPRFRGLTKVVEFCVIAAQRRCKYVWMDTCCIDKSRSAELEESIRSMFRWYRNAKICVVHLADTGISMYHMWRDTWFTRGWTLQELLAPRSIKFFDAAWRPLTDNPNDRIADTTDVPLWRTISEITGIDVDQLLCFTPGMHNIRQTMVWASKRTTTRIEDIAYSLIGMLDVPLSIAYGEGSMAFYRLQSEIVQRSPDKDIFAWQGQPSAYNSMFASSPKCFQSARFHPLPIVTATSVSAADHTHALTNVGVCMQLSLYMAHVIGGGDDDVGRSGNTKRDYFLEWLGAISVVSGDALSTYDHLVFAILGDGEPVSGKSLAILLGYRGDQYKRYKRVAIQNLIWVDRVQNRGPAATIYIV